MLRQWWDEAGRGDEDGRRLASETVAAAAMATATATRKGGHTACERECVYQWASGRDGGKGDKVEGREEKNRSKRIRAARESLDEMKDEW